MVSQKTKDYLEWLKLQGVSRGRKSLIGFTKYTFPSYEIANCHIQYAKVLQRFIDGDLNRLIISLPAQHGKSELSSRRMPAYLFGNNPDLRLAVCGYSDSFASKFNRQIQGIMRSKEYKEIFPDITIPNRGEIGKVANSHEFEIVGKRGSLISVGIGGSLTGNPVDIAIIDDPYKDYEQAFSANYREKVWEWYESVLEKRLHNDSKIIIVMTRWHDDDLVGRILKNVADGKTSEQWEQINFPAIKDNEKTEYDQREQGEALWPERHSLQKLNDSRRKNPMLFEAMDQGRPPKEGKKLFFNDFVYNDCVTTEDYDIDSEEFLLLTYDFNRNPVSCVLMQLKLGVGLFMLSEVQEDGGTEALLENKQEWLKDISVPKRIVGDNSGHTEKSSAKYTDYQLIKRFFNQKVEPETHKANRAHIHSRKICNYVFRNVPVFINEKRCPKLIKEILSAKATKDGKLLKNDTTDRNDLVDAMRYGINYYFTSIKEIDKFLRTIERNAA